MRSIRKWYTTIAATLAATAALALAPRAAHASSAWYSGYVCSMTRQHTASPYGTIGFVGVAVYSGAQCTGNFVGGFYLCGTGATLSGCQGILANDAQMSAFMATAVQAQLYGINVRWLVETGGTTNGIDEYIFGSLF